MATLTKKHMLYGAELSARKYREARRLQHQGQSRNAMTALIEADAVREALSILFASFNTDFNKERFFDACEVMPPEQQEKIRCAVAGVTYQEGNPNGG